MKVKRILLAEDDIDDREFFCHYISTHASFNNLEPVENGEELVNYLENTDSMQLPDVIILDQNMPLLNGMETLKFLKSQTRFNKIFVVLYSTYTTPGLVAEGTAAGAVSVMQKPTDKAGYDKMINEIDSHT